MHWAPYYPPVTYLLTYLPTPPGALYVLTHSPTYHVPGALGMYWTRSLYGDRMVQPSQFQPIA
jgi:hypothetical protein